MINKITYDEFLEKIQPVFLIKEIYLDSDYKYPKKRVLTSSEKRTIILSYFSFYFIEFFNSSNKEIKHFLSGTIKLLLKDNKPFIYWYHKKKKKRKMNFENVNSDLISKFIFQYEQLNNLDNLISFEFFKKNNK